MIPSTLPIDPAYGMSTTFCPSCPGSTFLPYRQYRHARRDTCAYPYRRRSRQPKPLYAEAAKPCEGNHVECKMRPVGVREGVGKQGPVTAFGEILA